MPLTRQHIEGKRPMRQRRFNEGIVIREEEIQQFLADYERMNRTEGTVQFYRRKMKRFYEDLPEDKTVRYGTLQNWRESLLQKGYTPGSVNAFLSAANSYLDYIGHREYQLAGYMKEDKPPMPELSRAEYLHLLQTAKVLNKEKVYLLIKLFASTGLYAQELPEATVEAVQDFDITDREAVCDYIGAYAPDAVIHCAGWTAVDQAEIKAEAASKANCEGTRNIAGICRAIGAKMLYISTDYVFSGTGSRAYEPEDPTGPVNVYGQTKLQGEKIVQELLKQYFIVRISWVFGKNGNNFVKTILRLSETKNKLEIVCDQIGSPTYTADLAPLLCDLILTTKYGIYHATNEGECSWAQFAEEIVRYTERDVEIAPIPTIAYPTRAARPLNSRLSKDKLDQMGFKRLPHWKDALARYMRS